MLSFTLAATNSAYAQTLGRLHVVIVHFPIALLLVAGVIELYRTLRGKRGLSPTATVCLGLGTLGALASAALGLIDAKYVASPSDVAVHQYLGLATAAVACLAVAALKLNRGTVYRYATISCAALVAVTGHFGGELTHGQGYLTELLFKNDRSRTVALSADSAPVIPVLAVKSESPTTPAAPAKPPSPHAAGAAADTTFATTIHPLLARACYDCHADDSSKGGLKVDSLAAMLKGGKSGPALKPGDADHSLLLRRVMGLDGKKRMPPPDDEPLTEAEIASLKQWITDGAKTGGMTAPPASADKKKYEAPVAPRKVELPPSADPALTNPIDLLLAPYYAQQKVADTGTVDDRTYARRVYLDVVGILPTPAEMDAFVYDASKDKRANLVRKLLADNKRYAENWLTFWNDALRNDYQGVGYIDGGRKQITAWLYGALEKNVPYDQFVRGLINPNKDAEGFVKGIVWRGTVSASQRPELQAAQNISQVFLGINMKCASCHDSFINQWKLSDAYGLASVFSDKPLEMYRCEVATGKTADVQFIYPQLGSIDGAAPRGQKLARLADLLTSKDNGRFTRTIVNRFWARFMGRGIVEPVDEMDNEPWNADLLDYLAGDLVDHGYDLKHTIELILTSRAYQRPAAGMLDPNAKAFTFAGPVVRRMSAEQFADSVYELTDVWPSSAATPVAGGSFPSTFIWTNGLANRGTAAGTFYFRKTFDLAAVPTHAVAAITCDNEWRLLVNGHEASKGKEWAKPDVVDVTPLLVQGKNVIAIEATNWEVADKAAVNPAALWMLLSARVPSTDADAENGTKLVEVSTDKTWQWAPAPAAGWETATFDAAKWSKAFPVGSAASAYNLLPNLASTRKTYRLRDDRYRAVWTKADPLTVALGRPNREIAVTYRTTAATTLQALEMTNGQTLSHTLRYGAEKWAAKGAPSTPDLVDQIYRLSLARRPTDAERQLAVSLVGSPAKADGIEDLLWSLVMLPEFQLVY